MTKPKIDKQVAELMRLVQKYASVRADRAQWGVVCDAVTDKAHREVEAFARAALERPAVALRYRFPGDLQWQYTERRFQASPGSEIEFLAVIPKETP